mmetsp:Transcript_47336/g.58198  ORF Transcript_47336/g.58198 Transcript_47336/m.58198 type:complete len:388 (-) Transcript_47336:279-1442(-)
MSSNNSFGDNWAANKSNVPSRTQSPLLRAKSDENEFIDCDELDSKLKVDKLFFHKLNQRLSNDAISRILLFLNPKEIAIFKAISPQTKYIINRHMLRYCRFMMKKRYDTYVLKYIDNFDDMHDINIDTLTRSNKYTGNKKNDDIWYLLSDYWFNNTNLAWGTFERSNSIHKMNGEWKILNNANVTDNVFYFDVCELNAILSMLRHPLLRDNYHKNVKIAFDQRYNVKSKDNQVQRHYCVKYWTEGRCNSNPFKTSGIKISEMNISNNSGKQNNIGLTNEEILYCNFLTKKYYGNKVKWKWYNNITCKYIEYSRNDIHLINELECNHQSSKLFTSKDTQLISVTYLSEFIKNTSANLISLTYFQRITSTDTINNFEQRNYFKIEMHSQ